MAINNETLFFVLKVGIAEALCVHKMNKAAGIELTIFDSGHNIKISSNNRDCHGYHA